jgi:hypothetical protein
MSRRIRRKLETCEDCFALDVRNLHREGFLRSGVKLSCCVTVGGEPSGHIDVDVEKDALQLAYEWRPPGSTVWIRGAQRVLVKWTPCYFGGFRAWLQCGGPADGRDCGRRAAKLYLGRGSVFACRRCHGLAYRSQSETVMNRAVVKARKLRVRLGGRPSLLDPLPRRPPRMHRLTYYRLFAMAIKAQERALELEIDEIRRRFPGTVEETGFPPLRRQA